jgi:hypothetical protein
VNVSLVASLFREVVPVDYHFLIVGVVSIRRGS